MKRLFLLLTLLLPMFALGQSTALLDGAGVVNGSSKTNYIKNHNAQKNTANVTTSNLTFARSTTTPLYNGSEFNLTSTSTPWSATWSALAFDAGLKNRLCEVQLLARGTAAGTTTLEVLQNSVAVFTQTVVLDATNPKVFGGTFPCGDLTYASTVTLGGSGATTGAVEVGKLYLGEPVSVSSGAVVTEWQSYTPSLNNVTLGTGGTSFGKWRRVGDSAEIEVQWTLGTGGNLGGTFTLGIATIGAIDTVKLPGAANIGPASAVLSGTNYVGAVEWNGSSIVVVTQASGAWNATTPITWASGAVGKLNLRVPISGWAATDIVTPEASLSRVMRAYRSGSAQTITAGSPVEVVFGTEREDALSEFNTSTGRFTAKYTGWYRVSYNLQVVPGATAPLSVTTYILIDGTGNFYLRANSSDFTASRQKSISAGGYVYLTAGQYISLWVTAVDQNVTIDYTTASNDISYLHVESTPPGSQSFYVQGPVKAAESGTAIPSGYVGEKVTLTSASIAAQTTGFTANTTPLYTLPAGRWRVIYFASVTGTTGLVAAEFAVASNSSNDATGIFSEGGATTLGTANMNGITSGAYRFPATELVIDVPTTQAIYAKAQALGAITTVVVRGYAIRLN